MASAKPVQDAVQKKAAQNASLYEDAKKAGDAEAAATNKARATRLKRKARPFLAQGKRGPRKYSGKTEKRYIKHNMRLAGYKVVQRAGSLCEVAIEDIEERAHLFFHKGYEPAPK